MDLCLIKRMDLISQCLPVKSTRIHLLIIRQNYANYVVNQMQMQLLFLVDITLLVYLVHRSVKYVLFAVFPLMILLRSTNNDNLDSFISFNTIK